MVSRLWNPGIGDGFWIGKDLHYGPNHGVSKRRFSSVFEDRERKLRDQFWGKPRYCGDLVNGLHISIILNIKSRSQLLGSNGDTQKEMRSGEGTHKRLKISVPHFDNSELIKTFSKTVMGRCMNPPAQEIRTLLSNLPKIWKLEDQVVGSDLGFGKFQFVFEKEDDIKAVLGSQPYHFDYWMLALARWQPKKTLNFPSDIPFWVRVLGVPMEFRTVPTYESIGDALGRTVKVDLEHTRVQVIVDAFKELCFETMIDLKGGEFYDGEDVLVTLRYEKLYGYCEECYSLCHKTEKFPLDPKNIQRSPARNREVRDGNGGWHERDKHDDRAISYKGVVLNGNGNQHNRDRENRDYYGKGKGKMFEGASTRWVRTSEKGQQRGFTLRGNTKGPGEPSNFRYLTRDGSRGTSHESRTRVQENQQRLREETREDGEIKDNGEGLTEQASQAFQEELAKTQAEGTSVCSDPVEMEKGLQSVKGLMMDNQTLGTNGEQGLEMDDIQTSMLQHGMDVEAVDDLPEPTEEELEEMLLGQEEEDTHIEERLNEDSMIPAN